MDNLTFGQAAKACGGTLSDATLKDVVPTGIYIDSREIKQGALYVPIIGQNNDGHSYISAAFDNGAVCALTERDGEKRPHIKVASTFAALKDIAEYYRSTFNIPVIALTGSVGKTTAKDLLAATLGTKLNVLKTKGNFNNEYGVPQTVFRLNVAHQAAVLELGMNSFGEISRLSKITRPDVAMILNVGTAHIGRLGSREGILKAKTEIFDYLKPGGKVYLNGDDDKLIALKDSPLKPIFFGSGAHNAVKLTGIQSESVYGTTFEIAYSDKVYTCKIGEPGRHMAYATLAAVAIAADMSLSKAEIEAGIATYKPEDGRMKVTDLATCTLIDGSYNASRESILAGLDVLALANGRKVAIIGGVNEMDDHAEAGHRQMGQDIAKSKADVALFVDQLAWHMYSTAKPVMGKCAHYFKTQDEMIAALPDILQKKDTVFIKASNGLALKHTVDDLKKNF